AGAGGMMPMMPMAGGARGGEESNDRESSTWLVEDEDVWGGPEGTTPSTLG
ncbi:WXG100 family type VII secretion target, partial [Nonomuraea sp. K274]|nr:WXG100 family type VII secretion target [Nonomuraea cypriaca]